MDDRKIEVDKIILVFALRYSLGRNTSAPDYIYDEFVRNVYKFKDWELNIALNDILDYHMLHDDKSFKGWLALCEFIKQELQHRVDTGQELV